MWLEEVRLKQVWAQEVRIPAEAPFEARKVKEEAWLAGRRERALKQSMLCSLVS